MVAYNGEGIFGKNARDMLLGVLNKKIAKGEKEWLEL